jgi:hypothetical protein
MVKGTIEELGIEAQKLTIKLKAEGFTNSSISNHLSSQYGKEITALEVASFFKRNEEASVKAIKENDKLQTQVAQTYFNTLTQLNELNKEMWKFWYELRKNPEVSVSKIKCSSCGRIAEIEHKQYGTLLKASDHLLAQIRHVDEILGKLQKKGINITYNYLDLSKKLAVAIPDMLKRTNPMIIRRLLKKKKEEIRENNYENEEDEEEELEEIEN